MKFLSKLKPSLFFLLSCLFRLTLGVHNRHYKLCKKGHPFTAYYDVCFKLGFGVVNLDNLVSSHLIKMLSPGRQAWISTFQQKFFDKPMYISTSARVNQHSRFLKLTILLDR